MGILTLLTCVEMSSRWGANESRSASMDRDNISKRRIGTTWSLGQCNTRHPLASSCALTRSMSNVLATRFALAVGLGHLDPDDKDETDSVEASMSLFRRCTRGTSVIRICSRLKFIHVLVRLCSLHMSQRTLLVLINLGTLCPTRDPMYSVLWPVPVLGIFPESALLFVIQ